MSATGTQRGTGEPCIIVYPNRVETCGLREDIADSLADLLADLGGAEWAWENASYVDVVLALANAGICPDAQDAKTSIQGWRDTWEGGGGCP